jgi:hypothetical protein
VIFEISPIDHDIVYYYYYYYFEVVDERPTMLYILFHISAHAGENILAPYKIVYRTHPPI